MWDHRNGLPPYQVWTGYRVATRQLNLYHAARKENSSCRKTSACSDREKTFVHRFWECACAAAFWKKLIGHWTGQTVTSQSTLCLFGGMCQSMISPYFHREFGPLELLLDTHVGAAECVCLQLWHVFATMSNTTLGTQECSRLQS